MSWYGLLAIMQEARDLRDSVVYRQGPVACPNDGTPLRYNPVRGILFCPDGDYQVAGTPRDP